MVGEFGNAILEEKINEMLFRGRLSLANAELDLRVIDVLTKPKGCDKRACCVFYNDVNLRKAVGDVCDKTDNPARDCVNYSEDCDRPEKIED